MSAAGSLRRTSGGFTLIELLVVVAIVAIASASVGLAMRDTSQVALERDGQRLAALLESARAQSRASGVPVRWRVHRGGFRFEGLGATALPQQWLDEDTRVATSADAANTAALVLGPEPIIGPQSVLLVSRSQAGQGVRVVTDGVRPFVVQAATP